MIYISSGCSSPFYCRMDWAVRSIFNGYLGWASTEEGNKKRYSLLPKELPKAMELVNQYKDSK